MFKYFKRKRLIKELVREYELMQCALITFVHSTDMYINEQTIYDKEWLLKRMRWADDEFNLRLLTVNGIIRELKEL